MNRPAYRRLNNLRNGRINGNHETVTAEVRERSVRLLPGHEDEYKSQWKGVGNVEFASLDWDGSIISGSMGIFYL